MSGGGGSANGADGGSTLGLARCTRITTLIVDFIEAGRYADRPLHSNQCNIVQNLFVLYYCAEYDRNLITFITVL